MEPSYQTRKLIGRILLWVLLGGVAGAFWAQYNSPLVQTLSAHTQGPVRVAVFTQPAMRFTYDPVTRKVVITLADKKCTADTKDTCFNGQYDRFYIPQQKEQTAYWERFKHTLETWRFNPALLWPYMRGYVNALVQRRTNLRPSEYILLSMELPYLTPTDFAVEQSVKKKLIGRRKPAQEETTPAKPEIILPNQADAEKPLVVEILNASGKKGLALALTQYLREQNAKGLLRVDVLQYDNYPTQEETSFITDYSGKLVQVTQVSRAIGLTREIRRENSSTAICDSRIVLGKDFEMPL